MPEIGLDAVPEPESTDPDSGATNEPGAALPIAGIHAGSVRRYNLVPMKRLYLAGGLFNAAERVHNLYLERYLSELGYELILPQREALKFQTATGFDVDAIVRDCQRACIDQNTTFVGCIDGADADSGTCVEYGMALMATGRALVYRTDFRTAEEKEVGVNAMLRAPGTVFVYEPSFFTEVTEVEPFYRRLASRIHEALGKIH